MVIDQHSSHAIKCQNTAFKRTYSTVAVIGKSSQRLNKHETRGHARILIKGVRNTGLIVGNDGNCKGLTY